MVHLHPDAVRMDLASARTIQPFDGLKVVSPLEVQFGQSRVNLFLDVGDLSETGGWGDPSRASAEGVLRSSSAWWPTWWTSSPPSGRSTPARLPDRTG
jgi:hypothetical protein